ncbi:hypothetical protein RGQ13_05410 [Thalassotalea psychrophila]|uniref:Lipoprotein n=1 Tax=Thalassotalea psychrophila TaxID=3065647 RepID=A0ABY9TXA9_9GAMM|nr:hypothetical protein RGQ13_05410 [Colwelliaceae bacterium SQ149]
MSKLSHHNHNHNQFQFINFFSILFLCSLLSACGGGGGGSKDDTPLPSANIDSSNALQVLAEVSEVVLGTNELGSAVDFSNQNVEVPRNMSTPTAMSGATLVSQNTLTGVLINNTPIGPETIDCSVSGTQKLWGDLADLNTLSVGDTINIESNMCDDGYGEVVDGLLEMTITSIEGDLDYLESLLEVDVKFTDFMTTAEGESITFDGDISMLMDTLSPPLEVLGVSGKSFSIDSQGKTVTMRNFSDTFSVDTSTFPIEWQQSANGSLTSSEFVGSVNYETSVTLMGSGEGYPNTGELFVSDTSGASLRLIVIDAENVQIDADYDGDKVVDETFYLTWIEFEEYS